MSSTTSFLLNPQSITGQFKLFLNYLFKFVNELDSGWEQRNRPSNEVLSTGLGGIISSSLDTFPIYIQLPGQNQELFYNVKYKRHISKAQVICDHTANIIWYSGPPFFIYPSHFWSIFFIVYLYLPLFVAYRCYNTF